MRLERPCQVSLIGVAGKSCNFRQREVQVQGGQGPTRAGKTEPE